MVRLDKIIYMITCFKSSSDELEQSQYSAPDKDITINQGMLLVMERVGVVSKNSSNSIQKKLIKSIPFGRENFFFYNTEKHNNEICFNKDPSCTMCQMNIQCDYNNKKNNWKERNVA